MNLFFQHLMVVEYYLKDHVSMDVLPNNSNCCNQVFHLRF